jgi:hypothetical protein
MGATSPSEPNGNSLMLGGYSVVTYIIDGGEDTDRRTTDGGSRDGLEAGLTLGEPESPCDTGSMNPRSSHPAAKPIEIKKRPVNTSFMRKRQAAWVISEAMPGFRLRRVDCAIFCCMRFLFRRDRAPLMTGYFDALC